MATTISVNGADGIALARSSGIRLVEDDSRALVLRNQQPATRDGQPGKDAPRAIPGGPGGVLAVLLSESHLSQGAIHVRVIESSQAHQLPPHTEVPIGRDLRLTAIGGIGESGHNGGDGQRGLDGVDGSSASKGTDATSGTDGGNGGAAGRGSHGADGGSGGDVHILVDESSTHLLMNISWDVRGGIGGRAGRHGTPGEGGTGGIGGEGWQWEDIVGYRYYCTTSCLRNDANAQSSSLVRAGTHLNASRSHAAASARAVMAPLRAHAVSGTNLERFIAQAAVAYSAMRTPRTDPGFCKCGGGSGNCAGCDMKPIRSQFKRAPGLVGKDGESGAVITEPLAKGLKGDQGSVTIAVQHADGTTRRYTSAWVLELVDFEVEDDNGDGVFEPGEYLHIRRVTVRNVGGMPSPTVPIPIRLMDHSENLEGLSDEEGGVAYLPSSVPATGEASMEGSIKVRIRPNTQVLAPGKRFSDKAWVQIRADMPWLERRLPSFEVRKDITLSYPCGFGDFNHLSTVSQSSRSKVQYKIQNFGNQPIGIHDGLAGRPSREMEVSIDIPHAFGRFTTDDGQHKNALDQPVSQIRPQDTIAMQQLFQVLPNAEDHKKFSMAFNLYLEAPQQSLDGMKDMVLVERRIIQIQVSSTYMRTPNAKFLLVTNPRTRKRQSEAIQHFIRTSLSMEVDLCNVHQNGGLMHLPDLDLEEPISILLSYYNKTILFLDDEFDFLGCGARTAMQLCDPLWLRDLAMNHSSALFIGSPKDNQFGARTHQAMLASSYKRKDALKYIKASRIFASPEQFVDTIVQERGLDVLSTGLSAITIREKKWYSGRPKLEKEAEALASYLRDHLPNERFLITHDGSEHIIINTGVPLHNSLRSIESGIALQAASDSDPTLTRLDRYIKYMIVSAIPFAERVNVLWGDPSHHSTSITIAIQLSILQDLSAQIHNLQSSHYKKLLRIPKDGTGDVDALTKTHLPLLHALVSHPNARISVRPPNAVVHILQWLLALAPTLKRHKRLGDLVQTLFRKHASASSLLSTHEFLDGVANTSPEDLLKHVSDLTQTPEHVLLKGVVDARSVVKGAEYITPREWDTVVEGLEEVGKKVRQDVEGARRELERMEIGGGIGESPADSVLELSA